MWSKLGSQERSDVLIETGKYIFVVKARSASPIHQSLIDVAIIVSNGTQHYVVVKFACLNQVQHVWSDGTVLFLQKLTDHSEVLRGQVLGLS